MKTIFLLTGKTRNSYLTEGIKEYQKRIVHYLPFELREIPDLKNVKNFSPEQVKEMEGTQILHSVSDGDILVLLDEKGREFNSREFASFLESQMIGRVKNLVFAVGGAWGFSPGVYKRANHKISLSKMTFHHQLVRVVFMEQFYRALTIIKGEPYHND